MKNDYEMYQSLLSRYDEYQEKKKKRFITIKRTVPVMASFCVALALGFGYQKYYSKIPMIPIQPDIVNETPQTTTADTISNIFTTQAAVTDNAPTTTAVTSKAEQAATTVTQTEIVDNTDSGENIVQTEPTEIVMQTPVTTNPVQPPDIPPATTEPVQPPDTPPTTTKPVQPPDIPPVTTEPVQPPDIPPITTPTKPIEPPVTTTADNGGGEGGGLPWEYRTFDKRYFFADLQTGESYYSAFISIPADMVEIDVGTAVFRGFDSFYNEWDERTMTIYSISEYSEQEVIAVHADDTYYAYYNKLLDEERKNQILEELKKLE